MAGRNFEFIRQDDVFIWKNDTIKIEFYDPQITPFDETFLDDTDSIMYYYYHMDASWGYEFDGEQVWNHAVGAYAHDAPAIIAFREIIEETLYTLNRYDESWECHEDRFGYRFYSKSLSAGGYVCEDAYEIKKIMSPDRCDTTYSVFVGVGIEDGNTNGININNLNDRDIGALLECVEAFIQYSLDRENERINKCAERCAQIHRCVNGRFYVCGGTKEDGAGFSHVLNSYSVGDRFRSVVVAVSQGDYICEKKYQNLTISAISEEGLTFTDGSYIPFDKIMYVFDEIDETLYHYGPDEIAKDFAERLSESEREEFISKSDDELFEKFSEAILNHTAMCRDEHNLEVITDSEEDFANVYAHVRRIIPKIRELVSGDMEGYNA